jgi:hypothetical protein
VGPCHLPSAPLKLLLIHLCVCKPIHRSHDVEEDLAEGRPLAQCLLQIYHSSTKNTCIVSAGHLQYHACSDLVAVTRPLTCNQRSP